MTDQPEPSREFKARAAAAARALGVEKPLGFTTADLRARLPDATPDEVRNWLVGQDGTDWGSKRRKAFKAALEGRGRGSEPGMLQKVEDDLWLVKGEPENGGEGVQVTGEVDGAARAMGGIFEFGEMVDAIGRRGQERLVTRVLGDSPRYRQGLPFTGEKRLWRLTDKLRAHVPVPGRWIALDLRLTTARALPAHRLAPVIDQRVVRIGAALTEVRLSAGSNAAEMVEGPVGASLAKALGASPVFQDDGEGERRTIREWWTTLVAREGRMVALAEAWRLLDSAEAPRLVLALDVAFWDRVGAATKTDPAALSRGAVTPAKRNR